MMWELTVALGIDRDHHIPILESHSQGSVFGLSNNQFLHLPCYKIVEEYEQGTEMKCNSAIEYSYKVHNILG